MLPPLAVGGRVKCTGTYELTHVDVGNLKKDSSTAVKAVDAYDKSVEATAATRVVLEQVTYCDISSPKQKTIKLLIHPHKRFFVGCSPPFMRFAQHLTCLLYTSDAADE